MNQDVPFAGLVKRESGIRAISTLMNCCNYKSKRETMKEVKEAFLRLLCRRNSLHRSCKTEQTKRHSSVVLPGEHFCEDPSPSPTKTTLEDVERLFPSFARMRTAANEKEVAGYRARGHLSDGTPIVAEFRRATNKRNMNFNGDESTVRMPHCLQAGDMMLVSLQCVDQNTE